MEAIHSIDVCINFHHVIGLFLVTADVRVDSGSVIGELQSIEILLS